MGKNKIKTRRRDPDDDIRGLRTYHNLLEDYRDALIGRVTRLDLYYSDSDIWGHMITCVNPRDLIWKYRGPGLDNYIRLYQSYQEVPTSQRSYDLFMAHVMGRYHITPRVLPIGDSLLSYCETFGVDHPTACMMKTLYKATEGEIFIEPVWEVVF